ncbi:hypothetical protein J7I94_25940 [Streptomyces sp. ISL-12]|uniref:hypothetical protein n=1 Tax=Streptomyces sp. ISL-12 TaxID=2819177 RepID=UPI001BE7384D|nr:hypothetical protein [Streptomyces sp. ISL-12]MBT2413944.1 hypothetical protein [Streptomyces sp. ISL-12]
MTNPQQAPRAQAIRLIFEYEGDSVRLVSQQPVDMVISSVDTGAEARPGDFVEMRDDYGQRLARVPARGAFRESAEVFPENHTEPITRVDVEARGAFTVVVPAPAEAVQVAVVRVAPAPREAPPEAAEAARAAGAARDVDLATFRLER